MPTEFKYYLLEEDGRSMIVDDNGNVSSTSSKVPLENTPSGWKDLSIGYERDMTDKIGLVKSFTQSLAFLFNAQKIIRTVAYAQGMERKIMLLIQRLKVIITDTTYQLKYFFFYKGELDLSQINDEDTQITVPIIEPGTAKAVKANSGKTFEFPLDDPQAITIRHDGLSLINKGNFACIDGIDIKKSMLGTNFILPVSFQIADGTAPGIEFFTSEMDNLTGLTWEQRQESTAYIASADIVNTGIVNILLQGTIAFQCTRNDPSLGFRVRFFTSTQDIIHQNDYQIFSTALAVGQTYSFDYNMTIPLKPGEKLFMEGIYFGGITGSIDTSIQFLKTSVFGISFQNRYKTTYVAGFEPYTLFKKIMEKVAGSDTLCLSQLLQAHNNIIITCGDAIRGIKGATVKTSLDDFLEFCKVVFAAGSGIENNKLIIEEIEHFLTSQNTLDLGEAKNLKVSYATDLMANVLEIGYKAQSSDNIDTDLNGKFEFNNTLQFQLPQTRVNNKLSMVSPYLAQPYQIEKIRLNLEGKTTTDNSSDNQVFILNVDKSIQSHEKYTASKTVPEDYSLNTDIDFDSTYGDFFTENSDNSTFTYTGETQDVTIDIKMIALCAAASHSINLILYKNGGALVTKLINADGVTTDGITFTTSLHENDVIKVSINAASSYSIDSATLDISLLSTTVYDLKRVAYDNTSIGLPAIDPNGTPDFSSIFNIEDLTPKRLIFKHLKWINSICFQMIGQPMTFLTTEKNQYLKTVQGSIVVQENADVEIGTDRYFKAMYIDFDTEVPADLPDALDNDPSTLMQTNWYGIELNGILRKGAIAASSEVSQSYRVLLNPDTDITKLIL